MKAYTVEQTRAVNILVEEGDDEVEVVLAKALKAFENPGDPEEGESVGVMGIPAITETRITKRGS